MNINYRKVREKILRYIVRRVGPDEIRIVLWMNTEGKKGRGRLKIKLLDPFKNYINKLGK